MDDFFEAKKQGCKEPSLVGMEVLITAGPTYEPIDAVRFIGNYSSGRMGYALAAECARRGAQVHLVSGPSSLPDPQGVHVERVSTACEMLAACQKVSNSCRLAIFSAAVADYRPEHKAEGKMKRESTGASMSLSLVKNPDIAATLGAEKKENQIMVGFALETSSDHEEARRKMARKGMDLMVLNSINDRGAGFGTPTNKVTLIPQEGEPLECSLKSKEEVAKDILNYLTNHYLQQ